MNDKELLEAAARAAGVKLHWHAGKPYMRPDTELRDSWNPLTDDGDALRLAVKLGFLLRWGLALDTKAPLVKVASYSQIQFVELVEEHTDAAAATRRAIVRAAAEIGSSHNAAADAA